VRKSHCKSSPGEYAQIMRTRLKLNPGARGTKKQVQEYGERLICVGMQKPWCGG